MPTRPTSTPEWASGASRRIEPSAGQKSDGFVGGERTAAKIGNWIVGFVADWAAYLGAIIDANEEHTYQTPKARTKVLGMPSAVLGTTWTFLGLFARSEADQATLLFEIDLPSGCVITGYDVVITPGAARTGGDRVQASITTFTGAFPGAGSSALNGQDFDDGTTGNQLLSASGLSVTIDRTTKSYAVAVQAGNDAGTNKDSVINCRITFNDVGPRN